MLESTQQALPGITAGLVVFAAFLLFLIPCRRLFTYLSAVTDTEWRPVVRLGNEIVRYT